jgi:hypothetical protein
MDCRFGLLKVSREEKESMKKIFLTAGLLSLAINAQALKEFETGDIVTAADINGNFSELDEKIESGKEDLIALVNGQLFTPNALANGEPARVTSYYSGYYTVDLGLGGTIAIRSDGYPATAITLYYASGDCSGQGYLTEYYIPTESEIGEELLNPNIPGYNPYYWDGETVYKGREEVKVGLHYQSRGNPTGCQAYTGYMIASALIESNDFTFPLAITAIGEPLIVSEVIGGPSENEGPTEYGVYADGEYIGTTSSLPTNQTWISVTLSGYGGETISVRADGSHYGFSVPGADITTSELFYMSPSCVGTAYKFTQIRLYDFVDIAPYEETSVVNIKNGDQYYEYGGTGYRAGHGTSGSYRTNSGHCYAKTYEDTAGYNDVYYIATEVESPDPVEVPVFSPPITIEGWDPLTYSELEEAQP